MKQPSIKVNDPQPSPCDHCKGFYGYQYSDHMKIHYTSVHSAEGKYETGAYSEGVNVLNRGTSAYCAACGLKMKFKIIRSTHEQV